MCKNRFVSGCATLFIPLCLLLATAGCRSHHSLKEVAATTDSAGSSAPSAPIGGTYCLTAIEQGPAASEPLHFSYKKNQSDGSATDFEGDLAGDIFDSTIHERHKATDVDREMNNIKGATPVPIVDGFAENTRKNHYTRSDASGWLMGSNGPVQAFTPWGLFIAKPDVKQVGTESIAGFDAIKYSVDTSHQSQLDKTPLMLAGRMKDYKIEGSAWVDKKLQCILQYNIDYEEDEKDGTISKTHYEGSTTRK